MPRGCQILQILPDARDFWIGLDRNCSAHLGCQGKENQGRQIPGRIDILLWSHFRWKADAQCVACGALVGRLGWPWSKRQETTMKSGRLRASASTWWGSIFAIFQEALETRHDPTAGGIHMIRLLRQKSPNCLDFPSFFYCNLACIDV
jgi:hypothetical protein